MDGPSPSLMLLLSLVSSLPGCESSPSRAIVEPVLTGKHDAARSVDIRGSLAFGEEVFAAFTEDLEFHGYTFEAVRTAELDLEVTQRGSARGLDTTLFLFGPRDAEGMFGGEAIWFDDDAGWGRLSKLEGVELEEHGTYLVVIGTADARGRGDYRLQLRCNGEACAPSTIDTTCHPRLVGAIEACIADTLADPENHLNATEALDVCADAEVIAPTRDAICHGNVSAPEFCALDYESFYLLVVPGCRERVLLQ